MGFAEKKDRSEKVIKANYLRVAAMAVTMLVAVVLAVATRPAEAAFPGTSGAIAFTKLDCVPTSFPDGSSGFDCNTQVYRMNADGFGSTKLTDTPDFNEESAWSADGMKLAFTNSSFTGPGVVNHDVYVMNADGSGEIPLTGNSSALVNGTPAFDGEAAWFPGGHNTIAFVSNRDGDFEIYKVSFDAFGNTTVLTQLTKHPDRDLLPSVSPDGKKVAFVSNRDGDNDIYVMKAVPESATNKPVNLTRNANAVDSAPDWSPDGRRIVFESNRDGDSDIFVMNADGTKPKKLTTNTDRDATPVFSPDGKKIAFASNRDAITDLWRMRVDGTHPVNITNNNSSGAPFVFDPLPDWQPLP